MLRVSVLIAIAALVGCASPGAHLNRLSLGMTKEEAIKVMGTPDSTKARSPQEILVYEETEHPFGAPARTSQYWVILQSGRVVQYGQAGDFGSALPPTQHVIIDKNETVNTEN